MSFAQKEKRQINKNYFTIIRELDDYFEVMSKNTEHLWIIKKTINNSVDKPFIIYHKHNKCIPYYHRYGYAYSLLHAIKQIKSHDKYVLETKDLNEYNKSKVMSIPKLKWGINFYGFTLLNSLLKFPDSLIWKMVFEIF